MGLSLSVLVGLVIILPGAAFVFGLSRLHSPTTPTTVLDQHLSVGLAITVLATIALHAGWLALFRTVCVNFDLPLPSVAHALALMSGDTTTDVAKAASAGVSDNPVRIAAYFITLTIFAWYSGKAANRRWRSKPNASWFELLRPKGAVFVWLTADLQIGSQCYLYAGVVDQFSIAKDGRLERVVLEHAVRRPMQRSVTNDGEAVGWDQIAGEFCVLQMTTANTINLDYFFQGEVNELITEEEVTEGTAEWSLSTIEAEIERAEDFEPEDATR